jgi:transcriptional regulator with XRE-family HTH domain
MKQETYNDFVRNYRIKNRIKQEDLANHLGFTAGHMSHIENGHKSISLTKLKRIVTAINELSCIDKSLKQQADKILKS